MNSKITERVDKAIEIKMAFTNLGIVHNDYEIYPELEKFSKDLNIWVKTGEYFNSKIKVEGLKKILVYKLNSVEKTMVKLSEPKN